MKILQEIKIMEEARKSSRIKLIISTLFLLLFFDVLLLKLNPLPGYVYSFYEHVPLIFWVFSIIIFFGASILLIEYRALPREYIHILFLLILLNNATILFSPYICGAYLMNNGDLLSHGGMVLDIFYTGKINYDVNFYPFTHILAFSILSLCDIGYIDSVMILSPIFSLLHPIYYYILAKEITDNRFVQKLTFLISSTFYLSNIFQTNSITTPLSLSFLMLPLLFFLFIKNSNISKISLTINLILVFSTYTFIHPLTSIVLIFSFFILYVFFKFAKKQFNYNSNLFFLCMVSFYFLYIVKVWISILEKIYNFLQGYQNPLGYVMDIQGPLSKLSLSTFNFLLFFIQSFGHQALLLLLTFFSFILILFRQPRKPFKIWFLTIFAFMLASGILFLISLVFPSAVNVSFLRFLKYLLIFTPIFSSIFLSTLRKKIIIIFVLLFLFINSLLIVYPSPYIYLLNSQVTRMDLSGSQWVLNYKKSEVGLSGYYGSEITIRVISSLIPYSDFYTERYTVWYDKKSTIQDHLGYEKNNYVWDALQEERYLIISKFDIVAYTQIYTNLGRISLEDIEQLRNDYTALFVYDNREYTVFYILR